MLELNKASHATGILSQRNSWLAESIIAIFLVLIVLVVWLAFLDQNAFHWQLRWPEVLPSF
jgi:hypothetical protein